MSEKAMILLSLAFLVFLVAFASGCTTGSMRRQNQRIEDLERRISKIEFDYNGEANSFDNDDFMKYREMADGL